MLRQNDVRVRALLVRSDGSVAAVRQPFGGGDVWVIPGGGVQEDETLQTALRREICEEVGILLPQDIHPEYLGVREILVRDCTRSHEHFFRFDVGDEHLVPGIDPDAGTEEQPIREARWIHPDKFREYLLKPDFTEKLLSRSSEPFYVEENLTFETYVERYRVLPTSRTQAEIVHVMLKPDALEHDLEMTLLEELELLGGRIVFQKRMRLSMEQLRIIYYDFDYPAAEERVFGYLTDNDTHHLAVAGPVGFHEHLNRAKGKTGSGKGLRGKYVTWYTLLDAVAWDQWRSREHPQQDLIDLELFCRNLLHVAPTQEASLNGFRMICTT